MGENKNLFETEAIEKLKEYTEDKVCMMCTYASEYDMQTRPMSTNRTDFEGNIYFLSDAESEHNDQLKLRDDIDLIYSEPSKLKFCTVRGKAEILRNQVLINELWNPIANNWFDGKEDPRVTIIKVAPIKAHYWDTKSNKFVSFLKMAAGALTGTNMDDGIQGDIHVN